MRELRIPKGATVCKVSMSDLEAGIGGGLSEKDKATLKRKFKESGIDRRKKIGNAGYEDATNSYVFYQPY